MRAARPISILLGSTTRPCSSTTVTSNLTHRHTLPSFAVARATNHDQHHRRPFTLNPFTSSSSASSNQTITATRTLPYPQSVIYSIIADVASYSSFLPYCHASTVTAFSAPAPDGKRYPEEATLRIGFVDGITESFTSRVYCVPERVVEAVSGAAATAATPSSLRPDEIAHHSPPLARRSDTAGAGPAPRPDAVMETLRTRWTLRPVKGAAAAAAAARTEVDLVVEFAFANPFYAAIASAAAPKVADKMIEAFEQRVKAVVDGKVQARHW